MCPRQEVLKTICKPLKNSAINHSAYVSPESGQMMKDKSGIFPKLKLVEAVSKSLKDNSVCLFSSLHLPCGCGEGLECQQDGLEVALECTVESNLY